MSQIRLLCRDGNRQSERGRTRPATLAVAVTELVAIIVVADQLAKLVTTTSPKRTRIMIQDGGSLLRTIRRTQKEKVAKRYMPLEALAKIVQPQTNEIAALPAAVD